jgi:F-type H+-transporting ATPase subunit b
MDQTLRALTEILQQAVLTVFLFVLLYGYLNIMLFGPLRKVLKQRDDLTAGTRKAAQESLAVAERKTAEYEGKLRDARTEIYREQEEQRRLWLSAQAEQVAEARARSEAQVRSAKESLLAEAASARQSLDASIGMLADEIVSQVLGGKAGREHA